MALQLVEFGLKYSFVLHGSSVAGIREMTTDTAARPLPNECIFAHNVRLLRRDPRLFSTQVFGEATWTAYDAYPDSARQAMARLRAVVNAIQGGLPLPPPARCLDDLLARAAQRQGRPHNVEEWARRLAEDIRNLTD